jgi:hypothetical protein
MSLSLSFNHELAQELSITGGLTQSVFPRSERWLKKSSKHQRALRELFEKSDDDRLAKYRSLMDAVFCESFPHEQEACFAYYANKGPKLNELKRATTLKKYDSFLLRMLQFAHRLSTTKLEMSWVDFRAFTNPPERR